MDARSMHPITPAVNRRGTAPTDASRPAVNRAWVRTVDARLALIDALFAEDDGRCTCGDYPQDSTLVWCVGCAPEKGM